MIRTINEKLRSDILAESETEFLRNGYQGASVRRISAAAGVSTGAIYTYFPNKSALFDALVAAPSEELKQHFIDNSKQMEQAMAKDITPWREWLDVKPDWLIDFLYQHYNAFRLLACCANGSRYENYIDSLVELETDATVSFIGHLHRHGIMSRDIDKELVHITVSTQFAGIFEPIAHDMPKEKALDYVRTLGEFYSAGWKQILGV